MKLDDRADKLGKYSPQCDLCTKEEGIWSCSFYGDTPDEYWLDKKKCPEFSSTKVKEYVLGKMKGGKEVGKIYYSKKRQEFIKSGGKS